MMFPKRLLASKPPVMRAGAVVGGLLFGAIWTQTLGLQYTTAGRSGFITALYVPLTPLIAWIIWKQKITFKQTLVMIFALFGLYVLTQGENLVTGFFDWFNTINTGDAWTILTALICALHILAVEYYSRREADSINLGIWQFIWCAICAGGISLWSSHKTEDVWNILSWSQEPLLALFVTVVFSTCFGFTMQIICQKTIGSLKAALIFALEAPFAIMFAFLFIGEKMGTQEAVGALIVFLTSIIPESWLIKTHKSKEIIVHGPL